jgi:hypothetical protein
MFVKAHKISPTLRYASYKLYILLLLPFYLNNGTTSVSNVVDKNEMRKREFSLVNLKAKMLSMFYSHTQRHLKSMRWDLK